MRRSLKGNIKATTLLFALAVFYSCLVTMAHAETTLLVTETTGLGIKPEDRLQLTRLIRKQLGEVARVKVFVGDSKEVAAKCLKSSACLTKLAAKTKSTHLLKSRVQALGSTFSVRLQLYNLQQPTTSPIDIKAKGKRAITTFEESMRQGLQKVIRLAGLSAKGTLSIAGLTDGSSLFVDDKLVVPSTNQQTLSIKLTPGAHKITVEQEGFVATTEFVDIQAGGDSKLAINMRREKPANYAKDNSIAAIRVTNVVEESSRPKNERSKRWYKKWWVWGLVSGVVASAATAAVIGLSGGGSESSTGTGITNSGNGGGNGGDGSSGGGGGGGSDDPFVITGTVTIGTK